MEAALWQEVKVVLATALELPDSERAAYLDEACAGYPELRSEVESLLHAGKDVTGFIETPGLAEHGYVLAEGVPEAGTAVGAYQLGCLLGRGGMGVVYLATRSDGTYRSNVAIKMLPPWLASDELVRRFRDERQMLATLDHPNIARLIDGGTTPTGSPYLVMEYVHGEPLDKYCDARQLSIDERLTLFRTICSAVQYAHQHLIIHRDLKPSNVLVTSGGVPKLLDFGIAKLLDPDVAAQRDATRDMRLFTPGYASPEQIRGENVTTAADVHALGVLLYLIMCGRHPFDNGDETEHRVMQAVCERDPVLPSAVVGRAPARGRCTPEECTEIASRRTTTCHRLHRQLCGDLDNIIAKALAKDPAGRYTTVDELAADVARHQRALPVRARPRSLAYRAQKFVRRNRWNVAIGGTAFAAMCTALVIASWQATVANAQRVRAEHHLSSVRKLANAVLFDLNDELAKSPTRARKLMVDKALEYLNTVAEDAGRDADLQRELAAGYEKIAAVQGHPGVANLGDTSGALLNYRKALQMRQQFLAADPENLKHKEAVARDYEALALIVRFGGDLKAAHDYSMRALHLAGQMAKQAPANVDAQLYLASQLSSVGTVKYEPGHASLGDMAGAIADQARALAIREEAVRVNPSDRRLRMSLDGSYQLLADLYLIGGQPDASAAMGLKCKALLEPAVSADPENAPLQRRLALCYRKIAHALAEQRQFEDAIVFARASLELREALARADAHNVRLKRDVALGYSGVGAIQEASGDYPGALRSYEMWLSMAQELAAANPKDHVLQLNMQEAHGSIGDVSLKQRRYAAAVESYRQALVIRLRARESEPSITDDDLANLYSGLGIALVRAGSRAEGAWYLDRAVVLHQKLVAADAPNAWAKRDLALAYARRAEAATIAAGLSRTRTSRDTIELRQSASACSDLQSSAAVWQGMRNAGTLSMKDLPDAQQTWNAVATCMAVHAPSLGYEAADVGRTLVAAEH
ncbi:MAG: protein kinase [Pseudomonadota bacterium]|nr:protein kinase [Pseudomonadota bacterium]